MIRVGLRSLLSRKLRTGLTMLAILLGVAMITGTYVLTDQISHGFKDIYNLSYGAVDAVITPKVSFGSTAYGPVGFLPESLLGQVRRVDGVADANGYVYGNGTPIVGGKPVKTGGAPTIVYSYLAGFEPDKYAPGVPPTQHGQVGVIKSLADKEHLHVGQTIGLSTEHGVEQVTISGIFTFANSPSMGGATVVHTTLADAQQWFDAKGKLSEIYIKAAPGVDPNELVGRIAAAVGPGYDVKTGQQTAASVSSQLDSSFISPIRTVLLVFGGVAVLVGAFIIFNTFSITVAQRLREFAMLRTLGSTRRQVLGLVVLEAVVMGLIASLLGLAAGVGLAKGLNALFHAVGADIPVSGIILAPRTVVVALVIGVGITLLAALVPAVRATRVPPMVALHEGASLPPSRASRFAPITAAVIAVAGTAILFVGLFGAGSTRGRLYEMAAGAILLFVATAMVAKHLVKPLVAVIAWPMQLVARSSGRLARENSVRNTGRTAATAAAMMIGVAVVVFVAVFAQSLKSSFVDAFDRSVRGDFVVTNTQQDAPVPAGVIDAVKTVPGVQTAATIAVQAVQVDGSRANMIGVNPADLLPEWNFQWLHGGSDATLAGLSGSGAVVEERFAADHGLHKGSRFAALTQEGKTATFTVVGQYRDPALLSGFLVTASAFAGLFEGSQLDPWYVVASVSQGSDPAIVGRNLVTALQPFPTAKAQTRQEYVDSVAKQVNQTLMLFYILLALSVIISLFGIVNTLVLAVYERTREIGMLRAIGAMRRQIRRIVRYESVITALIGAALGIVLGVLFGFIVMKDLSSSFGIFFAVPWGQLVAVLFVAVIAGILAAIVPARRAARIDILDAIHYE
jgi:putative ABC transport system permease protein